MKIVSLSIIKLYQTILSPFLGNNCRFYPSCSNYAIEAIKKHGSIKGYWLSIKRIMKCQPFHKGGFDQIPQ